jgi:hypothetical protein
MRAVPLLSLLLSACVVGSTAPGDDQPAGDDTGDPQPDAGGQQLVCDVPASLPAPTLNVTAERRNQQGSMGARQYYRVLADFDGAAAPDRLSLELWDTFGVFTADVVPGTYTIAGAETSLETCGVCAAVLADFTPPASQFYLAKAGTITIDTVEPTLAGSISGLQLEQIDGATGAVIPDGCTATLPTATFSATVTIVDGGDGGGGGGGGG